MWVPPLPGFLKLNCAGSVDNAAKYAGLDEQLQLMHVGRLLLVHYRQKCMIFLKGIHVVLTEQQQLHNIIFEEDICIVNRYRPPSK